MHHFFWLIVRFSMLILGVLCLFSFLTFFPYLMDVKAMANQISLQVMNDGYLDRKDVDKRLAEFRTERGFLSSATLVPGEADAGYLLPGLGSPDEVSIKAEYSPGEGQAERELLPIWKEEKAARVTAAESSGTAPVGVLDRDVPIRVEIRTNYKVETIAFGKRLVMYLPFSVSSAAITIADYKW
ncbi:hypothetical protein PM3016_359 [Paenibacillus mucilaginosus 3016]|uniref:Uncharacterized protein n=1 Tax=Paenibacillus mucilaginosus 3016 TaxID=1116391 RepID=H6NRQ3_9BACL|nr:hypothetical protein [Paenibacillus mucilaginosus]AFC27335.1 hypothetical protein PM3016_359 [Paenibacillus mucilaginosus 3016]WFA16246.1 hypothetical protein ERY13_01950 [Paenibacillus mucilaginosus]